MAQKRSLHNSIQILEQFVGSKDTSDPATWTNSLDMVCLELYRCQNIICQYGWYDFVPLRAAVFAPRCSCECVCGVLHLGNVFICPKWGISPPRYPKLSYNAFCCCCCRCHDAAPQCKAQIARMSGVCFSLITTMQCEHKMTQRKYENSPGMKAPKAKTNLRSNWQ